MEMENKGIIYRFLSSIEKAGNKMIDPISIFFVLCVAVVIVSGILAFFNVTAIHPKDASIVNVVNLINKTELQRYLSSIVMNFQNFPPMALVLVVMIGVGVADKSGLMDAALHRAVSNVPKRIVTPVIIFLGLISNVAGDAGFIVLPPLSALVFLSVGRHPLIGLFASFGGVAAGFAANIMIGLSDVLAAGFTIPSAQMIDSAYQATPAMNYYFILVSTFFLTTAGTLVTEKIIAPRFENEVFEKSKKENLNPSEIENKGLKWAAFAMIAYIVLIIALCFGAKPFLADSNGSILGVNSPFMKGTIPIITILFLIPGLVYGKITGSIKKDKDAIKMMGQAMSEMGPYIVLAFFAAQFLALFTYSNLGIILAIKGSDLLRAIGFTGTGLLVSFIVLAAFINLFIGSASAKWAIMAPIFVPMFLLLGYDPALTQMAYRIGDSISNPISPLFPYFPVLLGYISLYKKDSGIGTIISNMLPYSVCFFIVWVIIFLVWITLGIPLGPK
ncbi:MAG: AbgT family transporter [Elusimicrobiota bacterium]|jgi:aminobenzoyl-glutamate transport protein|nr:AbgT family transporter [Elusimicrobiota bacterium]